MKIPQRRSVPAVDVTVGDRIWRPTAQRFTTVESVKWVHGELAVTTADGLIVAIRAVRFLVAKDQAEADRFNEGVSP